MKNLKKEIEEIIIKCDRCESILDIDEVYFFYGQQLCEYCKAIVEDRIESQYQLDAE